AVEHALHPRLVAQVPVDGVGNALLEAVCGRPAKLGLELGRIYRIAAVVPGAVLDVGDLRAARLAVLARSTRVEQRADGIDDLDVGTLGVAADVVGLADAALPEHRADRRAVIADVQPVAHGHAVAVDGPRLASDRLG